MELLQTFQSLIALNQAELPYSYYDRELMLPIDKEDIITVSGVRRCGKSSLLGLAVNALLQNGVKKEQILMMNFDDERLSSLTSDQLDTLLQAYRDMYPQQPLKEVYMFFDEIQLVTDWELFVMRVYKHYCKHIYITGSTSKMLSGEMASALRGWPLEYREHPLTFSEYMTFKQLTCDMYSEEGQAKLRAAFKEYCQEGGFPKVVLTPEKSEKTEILQGYFNTMIFRDMMEHYEIKSSPAVVRYFLKRVMDNLTKPTSINNIFNDLKSQGHKISKDALYQWIKYACDIFLFYQVPRYTKSLVQENANMPKYYICDHGLRNAVLLPQSEDSGKILENIVFLMLYGRLSTEDRIFYYRGTGECDFVIQKGSQISALVQVCWHLADDNIERELNGLTEASKVTGCKTCLIITFDQEMTMEREGISVNVMPVWKSSKTLNGINE